MNKELIKQQNTDNFNEQRNRLINDGYKEYKKTITVLKANIYAIVISIPVIIIGLVLFFMNNEADTIVFDGLKSLLFFAVLFVSLIVHELLHGITWSFFCKNGFKSIRFGIMQMLTPYCHCKEPLTFFGYILGGLMPFIVLGLIPFIISLIIGNIFVMLFAIFSIMGAGGDLTIAFLLLKYRKALIIDHPSECGFVAFIKE